MKLTEWGDFSQESLKKILENRQGLKLKTDGLTEAEIKRLLLAVGNKLAVFRKSNSQVLSEQNSYYMNLLLLESHLKGLLGEDDDYDVQDLGQPEEVDYSSDEDETMDPVQFTNYLGKVHNDLKNRGFTTTEKRTGQDGSLSYIFINEETEDYRVIKYNPRTKEMQDHSGGDPYEGYEIYQEPMDERWSHSDVTSFNNESKVPMASEGYSLSRRDPEDKKYKIYKKHKVVSSHDSWEDAKKEFDKLKAKVNELKVPSKWTKMKYKFNYDQSPRDTVRRVKGDVKNMGANELSRLHTHYQNEPDDIEKGFWGRKRGSPQDIQKRAIDKEFTKRNKPYIHHESDELDEKLSKNEPASTWIHDFVHSHNKKFKGKSEAERRKMALGAYYGAQHESIDETKWKPSEMMLDCLDDYMWNRGQFQGTDAEGDAALKTHFPKLTPQQRKETIRVWKQEMKDSGEDYDDVDESINEAANLSFDNLVHDLAIKVLNADMGGDMQPWSGVMGAISTLKKYWPDLETAVEKEYKALLHQHYQRQKNLNDYKAGNVRANWKKESIGEAKSTQGIGDVIGTSIEKHQNFDFYRPKDKTKQQLEKDKKKKNKSFKSVKENKNTSLHQRILAMLPEGSRINSFKLKNPNGLVQVEGAVGTVANSLGAHPDCKVYVSYTTEDGRSFMRRLSPKVLETRGQITEKAVSKNQQKFMGMVYAAKKGAKPASKAVAKAAKGMSNKEAKKYASTKHKGLPKKVGESSMSTITEKKKPSAGMSKKEKSSLAKKARAGKDIGKPGKNFKKVEKAAAKRYGSEEKGKKVAAAAMWKNAAKKESLDKGDYLKLMRVMQLAEEYDSVPARYLIGIKGLEGMLKEYKSRIDKLVAMNKNHVGLKEEKSNCNKLLRGLDLAKRERLVDSSYLEAIGNMNFFVEQVRRSRKILSEGEVEQAQAVLASKDLVDRLQDMLKDVGSMLNEELPPLVDSIRDQIGDAQAGQFSEEISGALNQLIDVVRETRQQVDSATRKLAGDEVGSDMEMPGGEEEPSDMDVKDLAKAAEPVEPEGDEDGFAGSDAAAGGKMNLGRERR